MHIRDQKTQVTFMDKNIDLIINSKFIGSQQTHRKKELHQIDLQETIVLRIRRERGNHLATNYGPIGLQWTTHPSSERHQWGWWTPSWWCLDWSGGSGTCGGWNWFSSTPLGFLEYWGIYRAKRRCGRPPRRAQPTRASQEAQARPGGLCPPWVPPNHLFAP